MAHTDDIITSWLHFMVIDILVSHSTTGWIPLSLCKFPSKDGSRIAAHDKL